MRRARGWAAATCLIGWLAATAAAADAVPPPRVEARSQDLLAVGVVQGKRLTIHVSRLLDNAPVRDAVISVSLRGTVHPTVAEADGSYEFETPDLAVPGAAAVVFEIAAGTTHETLKGYLTVATPAAASDSKDHNDIRQFGWWVLNFAVCIGFLLLWSRRRTQAAADDDEP